MCDAWYVTYRQKNDYILWAENYSIKVTRFDDKEKVARSPQINLKSKLLFLVKWKEIMTLLWNTKNDCKLYKWWRLILVMDSEVTGGWMEIFQRNRIFSFQHALEIKTNFIGGENFENFYDIMLYQKLIVVLCRI